MGVAQDLSDRHSLTFHLVNTLISVSTFTFRTEIDIVVSFGDMKDCSYSKGKSFKATFCVKGKSDERKH
jgi:hypothetical protein